MHKFDGILASAEKFFTSVEDYYIQGRESSLNDPLETLRCT